MSTTEVDKNIFLKSWAVHNVCGFNVSMDDLKNVHFEQRLRDLFVFFDSRNGTRTYLGSKNNIVLVNNEVKTSNSFYFGANLKLGKEQDKKILLKSFYEGLSILIDRVFVFESW